MKKSILLTALAFAGAGIVTYLLSGKSSDKTRSKQPSNPRSHHRVNVFARAKQHASPTVENDINM